MEEPLHPRLRISLLGGFQVCLDGREIPSTAWKRRKAAALVKLLALAPGHRLHREQVVEHLWPEHDAEQAANSLYQALHSARRTLDTAGDDGSQSLLLHEQVLQFAPDLTIWVDVLAFEAAALQARRSRDPQAYRLALEQYTGNLLPDDPYEEWAGARREALQAERITLLLELSAREEANGAYREAIAAAQQVIAVDPLDEAAHRMLMRLYARSGQRQHAIRQFHALRDLLASELGVEPDQESERLWQQILVGDIAPEMPYHPSGNNIEAEQQRHNLPVPVSSFIGRDREKAAIRLLLAGTRLLTLTGPGGCGKTRLALSVATELIDDYEDGVWFVDLAPLTDPEIVPHAVAAALGIRESPGQPLTEAMSDWLKFRHALLILDNCEHLIDSCARLAESLLRRAARTVILATSREPLRVTGETTWLVPSLSLPDPARQVDTSHMLDSEAVRLFLDRAAQITPGFAVTPDNAADIAELCRRLDGIPLAIELAAARTRALSLGQIVDRLQDRFDLLSQGSRTALSRQQTLKATLDWSHALLSEPERAIFARLAVFAGSFDLDAAETVMGFESPSVLDLLSQLVDRSLLAAVVENGVVRYRLLETMRHYALELLTARGELDRLRRAHAEYYAALAKRAEREIRGTKQREWLDQLQRDHDNLRAALEWYLSEAEGGQPEAGMELAGTLHWFWHLSGHFSEGTSWLHRFLELRPDERTPGLAMALTGAGVLTSNVGNFACAQNMLDEAIEIWSELRRPDGLALAITWSGWPELFQGRLTAARARYNEGLSAFTDLDDSWGMALASLGLGFAAAESDDRTTAQMMYEQGLERFRALGDDWGVTTSLQQLASLTYRASDFAAAEDRATEVLALETRMGDRWLEVQSRMLLGEIARAKGDYQAAATRVHESLDLARDLGHRGALAWTLRDAGFVALARHDRVAARSHFRDALIRFRTDDNRLGLACCLVGMAGVAVAEDRPETAARLLGAAQAMLEALGVALAPADRRELDRIAPIIEAALDETIFTTASEAGRSSPLDDVLTLAGCDSSTQPAASSSLHDLGSGNR